MPCTAWLNGLVGTVDELADPDAAGWRREEDDGGHRAAGVALRKRVDDGRHRLPSRGFVVLPELVQIGLGGVVAVADLLGGGDQLGVQQTLGGPGHHEHAEQRHQDR